MSEQPDNTDPIDPSEVDPFLVSQAARTHAQRAVENTRALRSELIELRQDVWTRDEHEKFSRATREADARARHHLNVLLTFSAIALVLILALWGFTAANLSNANHVTEDRLDELSLAAVSSCERSNATRQSTRELYQTLAEALKDTDSGTVAILNKAIEDLPEDVDCSVFARP
jgi:hypothetical protein